MLIFGLFTIDEDEKVFNGYGHYLRVYRCSSNAEIVSINFLKLILTNYADKFTSNIQVIQLSIQLISK